MSGYAKIIQSGNTVEIYQYSKKLNVSRHKRNYSKNKRYKQKANGNGTSNSYRSIRSIKRARQGFFRLVSANLSSDILPALCTFTCYEKLSNKEAYDALASFFKQLKKTFPDLRYIAVPEWQKRGHIHFHAVVWGIDPKTILHEVPYHYWQRSNAKKYKRFIQFCSLYGFEPKSARGTRNLQRLWARGFFDVLGATNNSQAIAGYMAKYLVKGLEDPRLSNSRAYSSSHNVLRPRQAGSNQMPYYLDSLVPEHKELVKSTRYDTLWLGSCLYESYKLN